MPRISPRGGGGGGGGGGAGVGAQLELTDALMYRFTTVISVMKSNVLNITVTTRINEYRR